MVWCMGGDDCGTSEPCNRCYNSDAVVHMDPEFGGDICELLRQEDGDRGWHCYVYREVVFYVPNTNTGDKKVVADPWYQCGEIEIEIMSRSALD